MRVFILEDNEYRGQTLVKFFTEQGHEVMWVKTYKTAIDALNEQPKFDEMSLDHDLGLTYHTGVHVAQHVVSLPKEKQPKLVRVHSANPSGARRIVDLLKDGKIDACLAPMF